LVPKSLDPMARGRKMPLPDARPSEKIAKLFPQPDPLKDRPARSVGQTSTAEAQARQPIPLPEARPDIKPSRDELRHRHRRGGR
jgi:membrane-bound lytic murein transglycosylase A